MIEKIELLIFLLLFFYPCLESFVVSPFPVVSKQRSRHIRRQSLKLSSALQVPLVPYFSSKSDSFEPQWLEIFSRLNRERIIFLTSEINDEVANQVISQLLHLDNQVRDFLTSSLSCFFLVVVFL
jgi:hypothetical protein